LCAPNGNTLELNNGLRGRRRCIARCCWPIAARGALRVVRAKTARPMKLRSHVFVKSEGGRWFLLQHELVTRGAAYVRPRRDNHARGEELIALEAQARKAERGMWERRVYRPLSVRAATEQAVASNQSCLRGAAPYRVLEGRVGAARVFQNRAALTMEGSTEEAPFTLLVFGENFSAWDGPALSSLTGARVRARGPMGVYRDAPQLCLEHGSQLEVLTKNQPT